MYNKICKKCNQKFPATLEYFQKNSKGKNQIGSYCKSCEKEYRKQYYLRNKDREIKNNKEYYFANRKFCRKRTDEWYKRNRDKLRPYRAKLRRIKRQTNVGFRLACNLRNRVNKVIKSQHKSDATLNLLGCSVDYLKSRLESKFDKGMSWDNYGKWHIDHIRPISSFDLSDPAQVKECFHYSNLQPLWATENLKKSNKWVLDPIVF